MKNSKIRKEMNNNFSENPAGNIMKELDVAEMDHVAGGAGNTKVSSGAICSITLECSVILWTAICCK